MLNPCQRKRLPVCLPQFPHDHLLEFGSVRFWDCDGDQNQRVRLRKIYSEMKSQLLFLRSERYFFYWTFFDAFNIVTLFNRFKCTDNRSQLPFSYFNDGKYLPNRFKCTFKLRFRFVDWNLFMGKSQSHLLLQLISESVSIRPDLFQVNRWMLNLQMRNWFNYKE